MRILHLVHQYMPEHVGGTELYAQTLARYQIQDGHSVALFCPSSLPSTGSPMAQDEDGLRVYRAGIGAHGRSQVFRNTFANKQLDQAFTAVLAQETPDIIHIQHLMGLPFSLVDQIEAAAIPFVITLHDYWYGCANAQLITNYDGAICPGPNKFYVNCGRCAVARSEKGNLSWLAPVASPMMGYRNGRLRQIIAKADAVIAPTHFVRQTYCEMGITGDNIIVVQHGIEVPHKKIETLLSQKEPRRPGTLRIGYIGSLGHQKGVHNLITAVNQLPHQDVRLTLYGGLDAFPNYVAQLKQDAQHPGIHFAGRIARDEIWAALANLDAIVMPTLWYEASPLTIQEAFAVKTPIVASRIGAMPEKISHDVDGLLVPPGDVTALRDALLNLLHNPALLPRLRDGIQPVYTMAKQVKEIQALYGKLRRRTVQGRSVL
ncbi:MAG: glycosyltransferase family 4 protein [Chloroflexi bacterium]|nr:glycosyltransferase family 4 protein [Chloroflexota bacterium]